jgi:hypothetical protein
MIGTRLSLTPKLHPQPSQALMSWLRFCLMLSRLVICVLHAKWNWHSMPFRARLASRPSTQPFNGRYIPAETATFVQAMLPSMEQSPTSLKEAPRLALAAGGPSSIYFIQQDPRQWLKGREEKNEQKQKHEIENDS